MHVNRRVGALFRMGEAWISRNLADTGLSSSAAYMVLELAEAGPLSLSELSHRVGVDRAYMTRMARSLEVDGFVRRSPDLQDGRSAILSITENGNRVASRAEEVILAWVSVITKGVEPEALAVTGQSLDKFYANALTGGADPPGVTASKGRVHL